MKNTRAVTAVVFGVVQGVGFRPFVYRLAHKYHYFGWVKNIGFGVEIHLESTNKVDFTPFFQELQSLVPPLAVIETMNIRPADNTGCSEFVIRKSEGEGGFVFISPDIAMCANCRKELHDPQNRRCRYPFINCTDCGPRYTIVKDLPYDRPQTTMAAFTMCPECAQEYTNPLDRRYHAQPIACPVCGPQVSLRDKKGTGLEGGIEHAAALIKKGYIVAVKGLGGFHLVCDPFNPKAVNRLRDFKQRKVKPFALMAADKDTAANFTHISQHEEAHLCSPRRPVVLLEKKQDIPGIAPGLREIGIMLPYTPLHDLLLEKLRLVVATSSNPKDSPIMIDEKEGVSGYCDFLLTHNRPIQMRADDSVMKVVQGKPLFLRRARGYVPFPQAVPEKCRSSRNILALGGELKDTISLYKDGYVVTSQFLGDLDEYQNVQYFEETLRHLSRLFDFSPELVVTDLHPDFHTTRYAQKLNIPHMQVQHHYAHVLAALLEHGMNPAQKVLGVAWDGFGYGADGTAWGGEFLTMDFYGFNRTCRLQPVPLPGGDLASRQPWRMALSHLVTAFGEHVPEAAALESIPPNQIRSVIMMIRKQFCAPLTSSIGRLFDAVSFLTGLAPATVEFEAEAPMLLEGAADSTETGVYPFSLNKDGILSFSPMIKSIIRDLRSEVPTGIISARFHNTLAESIYHIAVNTRKNQNIDTVVLVGGVFLNRILLSKAHTRLEENGFNVYRPVQYSPNDESLSLGQIAFALAKTGNGASSLLPSN
jgi:hydrogenase maturation protein HypF